MLNYNASDKNISKNFNAKDTSYYLQDTDDLCIKGATSDGKYVTVSYYSVYGELRRQGEVTGE